ncbi:MAG TPA: hypothetical protein DDW30_08270, partial [Clostridiales bacterium]|nr:hypothetical protein [Clostridiales bacterium]
MKNKILKEIETMKTKRILCLCLIACLVLPLMSLCAFADDDFAGREAKFGSYVMFFDNVRENPNDDEFSKMIYTSGTTDYKLFTAGGLERYKPATEEGYGVELHGADADPYSGKWGLNLRDWSYNASTDSYFSIHYRVKNATNTGSVTSADTCNNGNNKPVHLKITMDIQNDVWKTYSVKLGDHLVDNDGNKTSAECWPAGNDFWGLALPALEGEGAYYVIDYIGFFDSEEAVANEAAYWEAFHANGVLPATASVKAGFYETAQTVELTTETSGAEIYYTLDGRNPTKTSNRYSEALAIKKSVTLKTVAYDPATDKYSPVCTYSYELNLNATPKFSLKGGVVTPGKSVTITTTTADAVIHYTTDGSTPTAESPVYSTPIPITGKMTVKAIGVKAGEANSAVATVEFGGIVSSDIYWSFGGLVGGSADGTLSETQGVYHTDRFGAVFGGGIYNDEFGGVVRPVSKDVAENAIRIESFYFVDKNEGMPNGYHRYMTLTYKCPVSVQLEYHPNHYVDDAARDASRSQKIPLEASESYKTIVIDLWENSETWKDWVGDSNFTLQFFYDGAEPTTVSILEVSFHESEENAKKSKVADPNTSVSTSEKYTEEISVELKSATEGAKLYYTTDGSAPSATNGTLYSGAITISQDTVLKVIAVKDGYMDSSVMTFDYKVTLTVAQPNPSLAGGKYEGNQTVTITCATEGAKLYYTLD